MSGRLRRHLTFANVTSFLALFVALTAGSYAAITLPKNSVGPKQLKADAVTSPKVKSGSLLASDFKAGQLPAGAQGAQGPQGPKGDTGLQGPKGDAGANGATHVVAFDTAPKTVNSNSAEVDNVSCDPGQRATGGGVFFSDDNGNPVAPPGVAGVTGSYSVVDSNGQDGWEGRVANGTVGALKFVVEVVCASP